MENNAAPLLLYVDMPAALKPEPVAKKEPSPSSALSKPWPRLKDTRWLSTGGAWL